MLRFGMADVGSQFPAQTFLLTLVRVPLSSFQSFLLYLRRQA